MTAEINNATNIWDKRYGDGELACTKQVIEKDPIDYTQHPLLYQYSIAKRLTGSIHGNPLKQLATHFLNPPAKRILAIGSGMAFPEEWLAANGFAEHIIAYEASAVAVEAVRARLQTAGLEHKVEVRCGDVMQENLPDESFDVVFVQAAIHHFYDIEDMFALMHRVLRPDGLIVFDEYIGPDHHQYEPEVMAIMDEINHCLSAELRWDVLRKETRESVPAATLEWMLEMDPSEGVHASQILPLTYQYFDVVYRGDYAGTIMRPFWVGILPNFDFENSKDASIARLIILMEEFLTRYGAIPHYHTRIVGKKRQTPREPLTKEQAEKINYANWQGLGAESYTQPLEITEVYYKAQNHSDENWTKGIANKWAAAFFVKASDKARVDLAVGKKLTFSDGSKRTVIKQQENNDSLTIFLDGSALDGNKVGYPEEIIVSNDL